MSYILDALQRAHAERERAGVPGLHARPTVIPVSPSVTRERSRVWLLGAAALVTGGVVAGLSVWRPPAGGVAPLAALAPQALPATPATPVAAVAPVQALGAVAAASQPAWQAPTPTPTPTPSSSSPVIPIMDSVGPTPPVARSAALVPPASALQMPPQSASAPVLPLREAKRDGKKDANAQAPTLVAATASSASASASAAREPPLLRDLPEAVRSKIPALQISGAVYAQSPGQRLLIVNGQVLTQGSLAAPDVNLEDIGPHSSVFNFQGTRFRLGH